jgi:predicted permease
MVLVLTLGIAAATVTFSVVDSVVLRQLPFPRSDELVVLQDSTSGSAIFAGQEYTAWRDEARVFAGLAAVVGGGPEELPAESGGGAIGAAGATASLFRVLGVAPIAGQVFTGAHEEPGRDQVAVIGEGLARRLFGSAEHAVGRSLRTSRATLTILGVMPPGFGYPVGVTPPVELWTPLQPTSARYQSPGGFARYFRLVGRLESGNTPEHATAALDVASAPLRAAFPQMADAWPPRIVPLYDALVGDVRGWMLLVLAAVGLVMLVACANVANLLLARCALRTREMSVRAALGASRRQLVIGLMVESLLLSLMAAALGVLIATWGVGVAKAALPEGIARAGSIALDLRVLGSAVALAVVTGLFFGAVPAWQASRADLVMLVKHAGPTTAGGRRRWRTTFVVFEVAFVSVLLVATTLVVASFVNVTRADLGFARDRLIAIDSARVPSIEDAIRTLERIPNVASVAAIGSGSPPLIGRAFGGGSAQVPLRRADVGVTSEPVPAEFRRVSDSYFRTAGIPLLRGSGFDRDAAAQPVILDEVAARRLFPDRDPLGAALIFGNPRPDRTAADDLTVAGIVANVHIDGPEATSGPQIYLPLVRRQGSTTPVPVVNGTSAQFLLRTSAPASAVMPAVETALARLAPTAAGGRPPRVMVIEEAFRAITADRRFNAGLMGIFGALALVIGLAGIYGVLSSIVAQRRREIGIRVALGATSSHIRHGVIVEGGRYVFAGLAIGLPASWLVTRTLGSLYFGVAPTDVSVYAVVAALISAAGITASLLPARRAARVDPIVALKD